MNARLDSSSSHHSLKARILNALPAATYQMDRFLSLVDIVVSDLAPTAWVDSGPQPKMHVNPEFIAKHCRYDEQLLMLVLHELYHVILGHTQLFPRPTEAHNIAFDAYINALLCHQFKDSPACLDFFKSINGGKKFPARLLRPPVGWPGRARMGGDRSPEEIRIMKGLYSEKANTITYKEILDLLLNESPHEHHSTDIVLLGDHSSAGKAGEKDDQAAKSEILRGVLRDAVKAWPQKARAQLDGLSGKERGDGGRIDSFLMPKAKSPRRGFLAALSKLLARAGALPRNSSAYRLWKGTAAPEDMTSVFPDIRDRLAHGRERLWGQLPVLFTTSIKRTRPRLILREAVHVYLDVSGSMADELPWLAGVLDPLERRGAIRLYAFSTIVSKVPRGGLLTGAIKNTYGTDINCVLQHLLEFPKHSFPERTVILTDGYVGMPEEQRLKGLTDQGVQLFFGLIGPCYVFDWMSKYAKTITALPGQNAKRCVINT